MDSLFYFLSLKKEYEERIRLKLQTDEEMVRSLAELESALAQANSAFETTGSFAYCAECARQGVVCCGEGLEWKLSKEEFFLNLALLERQRKSLDLENSLPKRCLFLGKRGCKLLMPPLFCRNFFCTNLQDFLGQARLIFIQNAMGAAVYLSFQLGEKLKQWRI
jgi:hypothetical protein